jgi:DNA-binding beta-propeller fold protein YncE
VLIIDIHDPTNPRIIADLPLMNSIMGPPVNLAITPDQHLALVANSLWVKDGEGWKGVPDNKIYVIDLTTSPPVQIATVEAGKQPSGMAINRAGTLALVANRADDTVGVFGAGLPGSEAVAQSDRQKLPGSGVPPADVRDIRAVMHLHHQFILRILW